jgi:excinuclease ABC subunit C
MKPPINLPTNPGCYLYLDKYKKIIYIGKAKNIKKRVSSYFNKKGQDSKTKALVSHISEIDFIVTNTEVEAMVLENNLIKKYKPKYNIDLKDSKSFAYIELINEDFPRLIISRSQTVKQRKKTGKLFGPFVSGEARNQILGVLNKTFKLRTCKNLPKRKCIRYDIGICSAPCINKISKTDYKQDLEKAELILKGKSKEVQSNLRELMKDYSKEQNFEKALIIREQLSSLEYLKEKQTVERQKKYDEDIINFLIKNEKVYLMLFNIYKGTLENKQTFEFDYKSGFFEEFLIQYYSEYSIPKKIILPSEIPVMAGYLTRIKKSKVEIIVPQKGELKDLLELVKKNIEIQYFGDTEKLEELQKQINLQERPEIIECFDISHLGGTEVVASMVQFRNARPDKSNYRKFKIKAQDKNDDFAAMYEVVKRRYSRLKKENKRFPDLILVDGGLGQLNSSISALNEIGIKIPIVSLVKKFEEIYIPGKQIPLRLPEKNKARKLLEQIRDEAHRFAIKYQRERRNNTYFN